MIGLAAAAGGGDKVPGPAAGAGVDTVALEVVHDTEYRYESPVSTALHLAHLHPLSDAGQTLLSHRLDIDPEPAERALEHDVFGNLRCSFSLVSPHQHLHVRATSRVAVRERFGALAAGHSPPWEDIVRRLVYVARAPFQPAVEFVQPSPGVPRLEALRRYAREVCTPRRPAAEAAVALMHRVHADFRYDSGVTDIDTPLAEVFALRHGVCQDFAHVMIGALRMVGLPARYVSGYLLTRPPAGGEALIGADASHAWVQVWVPGTEGVPADGWLDLDPTNDLVPALSHIRVAVGRDFGDVTPLRGVIHGGGAHQLRVGVSTRVLPSVNVPGPGVA